MLKTTNLNLNLTLKAGVIGFPIDHSLSPIIHNYHLKKLNINGSYEKYLVPVDTFEESINNLIYKENLQGFNVTIPHKERMLKFCDHLSNSAKNIGAVNTIKILENGKLFGHNSDGEGFVKNLLNHYPDFKFITKKCLIIGAGGASRAIIYSLIKLKVSKIYIANRNLENVYKIIDDFKNFSKKNDIEIIAVELNNNFNFINQLDLIINTSSMGMNNQNPLNLDLSMAQKNAIICDIVYKPLLTQFLSNAKKNNLPILTGIGMLVEQAMVGFEMWYHDKPKYSVELENYLIKIANL